MDVVLKTLPSRPMRLAPSQDLTSRIDPSKARRVAVISLRVNVAREVILNPANEKLHKLEVLVQELLKDDPAEELVQKIMLEVGLMTVTIRSIASTKFCLRCTSKNPPLG